MQWIVVACEGKGQQGCCNQRESVLRLLFRAVAGDFTRFFWFQGSETASSLVSLFGDQTTTRLSQTVIAAYIDLAPRIWALVRRTSLSGGKAKHSTLQILWAKAVLTSALLQVISSNKKLLVTSASLLVAKSRCCDCFFTFFHLSA